MKDRFKRFFEKRLNRLATGRWARRAKMAEHLDLQSLRRLRRQARMLRGMLEQFMFVADSRLALPLIGSNAKQLPLYTDWSHRPELWRGPLNSKGGVAMASNVELGSEVRLFHDCQTSELTYRQLRNRSQEDLAPFALGLEVFRFDGSFLSLSIDFPQEVCQGLSIRHMVRLDLDVVLERPITIYARLNIQHGPNMEQVVRELPPEATDGYVEFDLAYTKLNEKRVEKLWLDLIFEGVEMNQILLKDLILSRHLRAEI